MAAYIIQWSYRTGTRGPWLAGERVDLTDADASAILRDSPGVLVAVRPDAPAPGPAVDLGERTIDAPPFDRQLRAPGRKRATGA